jgi:hypothetical protein
MTRDETNAIRARILKLRGIIPNDSDAGELIFRDLPRVLEEVDALTGVKESLIEGLAAGSAEVAV